jgi:hypothetical protein
LLDARNPDPKRLCSESSHPALNSHTKKRRAKTTAPRPRRTERQAERRSPDTTDASADPPSADRTDRPTPPTSFSALAATRTTIQPDIFYAQVPPFRLALVISSWRYA